LQSFLWRTPLVRKVFGQTPDQAETTLLLARNQGVYNAFLAAGLIWAVIIASPSVATFFLACVLVAGLAGVAVTRTVLFVQALPALIALTVRFLA
jgi:putative membrane protein